MQYNSQIHHRKSIRLKGYDYSQAGAYFVTVCCQDRECRFGKIENDEMILNEYGQIAYDEWTKLPKRFSNFELDVFQIMPNHMHGIIILNDNVGATLAVAQNDISQNGDGDFNSEITMISNEKQLQQGQPQGIVPTMNTTVGDIVGAYKSLVANGCLDTFKTKNETMWKLWQRNYHEHIIRNEKSYQTISDYILNNPAKWNDDKFYK